MGFDENSGRLVVDVLSLLPGVGANAKCCRKEQPRHALHFFDILTKPLSSSCKSDASELNGACVCSSVVVESHAAPRINTLTCIGELALTRQVS